MKTTNLESLINDALLARVGENPRATGVEAHKELDRLKQRLAEAGKRLSREWDKTMDMCADRAVRLAAAEARCKKLEALVWHVRVNDDLDENAVRDVIASINQGEQ